MLALAHGASKHALVELGASRDSWTDSAEHDMVHRQVRADCSVDDDGNSGTLGIAGRLSDALVNDNDMWRRVTRAKRA